MENGIFTVINDWYENMEQLIFNANNDNMYSSFLHTNRDFLSIPHIMSSPRIPLVVRVPQVEKRYNLYHTIITTYELPEKHSIHYYR